MISKIYFSNYIVSLSRSYEAQKDNFEKTNDVNGLLLLFDATNYI